MTLRRALMVLVLTALAVLSGCGDKGGSRDRDAGVDPGFGPITYVVTGVTQDGAQHPLVTDTEIRIRFGSGQVTLTAGCNTMSGNYTLEESRLTVEPLATTEMGCGQARMKQDSWLAGLFEKPVQFMSGDEATIVSGTTVLALSDREKVSPDKPMAGTWWQLDTIATGGADGVASSVSGAVVYFRIIGDRLTAWDGCNGMGGRVELTESTVTFLGMGMTDAGCGTGQREIRAMFTGTAHFAIEEGRITLSKGDDSLGFRAVTEEPTHD